MKLHAMAKINLGLDVLRKRPDGYHDVKMIMQTVRLSDEIELLPREEPGIVLTTDASQVPADSSNLVWRAADLLIREFGLTDGVEIRLEKKIPVAAGMAGGSSDAAAVLVGMNELFHLGLTGQELMERGVTLGADIPFCILRGTAMAEGIGEVLTELPPLPDCWILIGKPGIEVSTRMAYQNLRLSEITNHPDIDGQIEALQRGDLAGVTERMENVFQKGIEDSCPVVREIRELMEACGARKALMSGSGPTVFGIFDTEESALEAEKRVRESGLAQTAAVTVPYQP